MPTQFELLTEAYNRGILPEEKKPFYEEAVRRGLISSPDAGAGLSSAMQPLERGQRTLAISQAQGDIAHREAGMSLVPTAIDTSGTDVAGRSLRTLEPQQTQQPRQLTDQEKSAIISAHLADKSFGQYANQTNTPGTNVEQQYGRAKAITGQQRIEQLNPVENFNNEMSRHVLSLYPNLVDLVAPGTATEYKENLQDYMPSNPDSVATKAGGFVGGMTPYLLGPAGVAVGGTAQAGEYRDQVLAHNQANPERPISKTEELVGAATIIAANVAMGKVHPGESGLAGVTSKGLMENPGFVNAIQKYSVGAGYGALDMGAMTAITNHVEGKNPTEGVGEAMLTGAAIHGITHGKEFARDLQTERVKADQPTNGLAETPSGVSGDGELGAVERAGKLVQPPKEESPQQAIDRLTGEADAAEARLRSGETLAPEEKAALEKTVDHNRAVIMDHMMTIEDAEDAAAKPTPPAKYPDRTPEASADETFKKLMAEPSRDIRPGQEAPQPEQMGVDKASKKAAEIAAKGVGQDVKKLLGEPPPGMPRVPREAREWSYSKLKQWAGDNGYDVARAENLRGLRKMISGQQHNSLTDLPEMPKEASNWNFRRLKYWAGKNGYGVENAESRQEVKDIVEAARKADIQLTRKGATAEEPAPSAPSAPAALKQAVVPPPPPAVTPAKSVVRKIWDTVSGPVSDAYDAVVKPIGQRIREHSERLYGRVQEMYVHGGRRGEQEMGALVDPAHRVTDFLGGDKSARYAEANLRALNGDKEQLLSMFPDRLKPDVEKFYEMFRRTITEQKSAGVNIGDLGDSYWNRILRDPNEFRAIYGAKTPEIEAAWARDAAQKRRPLTQYEKDLVTNRVMQGYGPKKPGSMGPTHARERSIDKLTLEQSKHYVPWIESAFTYADRASRTIERYKLLGKNPENLDESIGQIIRQEIEAGTMKPESQGEVKDLLTTLLTRDQVMMDPFWRKTRAVVHATSLGQIRSMANQTSDAVVTAFEHGAEHTAQGYLTAAGKLRPGLKKIVLTDLGFHKHGEAFKDKTKLVELADQQLRGFELADAVNKEASANAAFTDFRERVQNMEGPRFAAMREKFEPVMGKEAFAKAIKDLKANELTDPVKDLLAFDLLERQPLTPASMPKKYLEMKNGRMFWQLKSYTLTEFDRMRRQLAGDFAKGDYIKGAKKMAAFAAVMVLFGMSKDAIVDLIRGKRVSPDQIKDRAADGLLGLVGLNRFASERIVEQPTFGAGEAILPAVSAADALWDDLKNQGQRKLPSGQKQWRGLKSVKYIPYAGDFINYRTPAGRGYYQNQEEDRRERNRRVYGTH